jgi:3-hydroxy-3-methylglutaryl CoA synthase
LFANNGLFSKIALNWDAIQKTIEEDITEQLKNRNEELEAYKKLSNANKKAKNKNKDNYEMEF